MKKIIKRVLCVVLIAAVLVGAVVGWLLHSSENYEIPDQKETIQNDTGLVQAYGRSLYDPAGNQLRLTGINAGQILLQEGWMSPFALEPLKNEDGTYQKDGDGNITYLALTDLSIATPNTEKGNPYGLKDKLFVDYQFIPVNGTWDDLTIKIVQKEKLL